MLIGLKKTCLGLFERLELKIVLYDPWSLLRRVQFHQPSSEAFFYFDRIILMADGYTCFQGEATEALDYFRSVKFNVPKRCNPSDFFMKALDVKYPKQADDIEKLERLNRAYKFQVEKRN